MNTKLDAPERARSNAVKPSPGESRFVGPLVLFLWSALPPPVAGGEVGWLDVTQSGTNVVIEWSDNGATLQSATNFLGPWISVSNATSPYVVVPVELAAFYRLQGSLVESLYVAPQYTAEIGNPISSCGCLSPENPNAANMSAPYVGLFPAPASSDPPDPGPLGSCPLPNPAGARPQDDAYGNVALYTGEVIQRTTDLSIPGVGFDWKFERTFRSGWNYSGPLGRGWDFGENRRLVVQPGGDVKRVDGAGRDDLYILVSGGTYQAPSGFYTRLTQNTDGTYLERDRHGAQASYSAPDAFGIARMTRIL